MPHLRPLQHPSATQGRGHVSNERIGVIRCLATAAAVALLALAPLAGAATPKPTSKHDRQIIAFFLNHPRLAMTPAGQRELWKLLHRLSEQMRTLQAARAWPAHHELWLCIHAGEADWGNQDTGRNGHYGGLQMHPGWGYGTSYHASDDSQLVQEQSAERGYRASGYSHAWLNGQWGQTIGPCWGYA